MLFSMFALLLPARVCWCWARGLRAKGPHDGDTRTGLFHCRTKRQWHTLAQYHGHWVVFILLTRKDDTPRCARTEYLARSDMDVHKLHQAVADSSGGVSVYRHRCSHRNFCAEKYQGAVPRWEAYAQAGDREDLNSESSPTAS